MSTAADILRDAGLPPLAPGRHLLRCPKCSDQRSRAHQSLKCLGVNVDSDGVNWGCNHCDWKGGGKVNGVGGHARSDPFVATYSYTDEAGELLFQVCRKADKSFPQRRPDGNGGWTWGTSGARKVLYRLPELIEAIANSHTVLIVEGEKDVENLRRIGVSATCNPGGASKPGQKSKWRPEFSEYLRDADIIIVPDNDDAGHAHAEAIAGMCTGIASRIRVLDLANYWPECPKGGDVSDWLAAGHTREELDALIEKAPDFHLDAEPEAGNSKEDILPVTEFAAMSMLSRKTWIVHHVIALAEASVWYGEPGSGKSVLIEDLALHVAAGRTWHGRAVRQGAVLYVALERAGVVARRAIAFGMEHGLTTLPFAVVRGPLDFRDPKIADRIIATITALAARHNADPVLVVVDTVSRALCGGDENSPKDMGLLVGGMSRIQSADLHLAMTHHQPAEKERMRGHGALLGAVDTTVHVFKSGAIRLAEVVKSSDHEEGQRVAFTLASSTIGQDERGDVVSAPVVVEADVTGTAHKPSAVLKGANKIALSALREAIDHLGEAAPASQHIPAGVKVTSIARWRDYAYRYGISASDEASARQKAFNRASERLRADNFIGVWEPHVWLTGR
jgi:hypothetical protein